MLLLLTQTPIWLYRSGSSSGSSSAAGHCLPLLLSGSITTTPEYHAPPSRAPPKIQQTEGGHYIGKVHFFSR
jgi:hypothetical protein